MDLTSVPLLQRPTRRSVPAQVADTLMEAVLSGRFPPGSVLPPERDLAEQLGINRTSLRQAIARLEQAGLVEARQGVGTMVRDPLRAADASVVMRALLAAGPQLVGEVLQVRQALGALTGRLAAEHITADGRAELQRRLETAAAASDAAGLQTAELALFSYLVDMTGNRPLQVMMGWLEQLYGAAAPLFRSAFDDAPAVLADLRQVVRAVSSGRPGQAESAVRRYADRSGARLLVAAGSDRFTGARPVGTHPRNMD